MQETTSSEFVDWMEYFNQEINFFHREDYYLAQIATEIRRTIVKNPRTVKVKDFIIKFLRKDEKSLQKDAEEKTKQSKAFWLGAFGIKAK